jgi:hypothetical protein
VQTQGLFSQTIHGTTNEFCCVATARNTSFFGNAFGLLKQTGQEFLRDKAPQKNCFSTARLHLIEPEFAFDSNMQRNDQG